MLVFKNELEGKKVAWQDGKYNSFTMEEILGENGVITFKALASGYKVEKLTKENNN